MTMQLAVSSACPYVYLPEAGPGWSWVAFVLPATAATPTPDYLLSDWTWPTTDGSTGPGYAGFWVFAPSQPPDLAGFARSLWASSAGKAFTQSSSSTSSMVWYDQATLASLGNPEHIATAMSNRLQTSGNVSLSFGASFQFYIPSGSAVSFLSDGDLLTITANGWFALNIVNSSIGGFDSSLGIALGGDDAGVLTLGGKLSFDTSPRGANLGVHYQHRTSDGAVALLDYPAFDIPRTTAIAYAVSLDPSAPFDGARTRFAFDPEAGARKGAYTGPLDSGFTTPTGQRIRLTPQDGAALVFRSLYGGGGQSCFEPDGPFLATLSPPAADGGIALLCGSAGTESIQGPAGTTLTFSAGASYCPFDPTAPRTTADAVPLQDQDGAAITAWVSVTGDGSPASYRTQPAQSALFRPDAAQPNYLFACLPRPLLTATTLPALPMAPYGCADDQLASVPCQSFRAFETRVLAPARAMATVMAAKAARAAAPRARSADEGGTTETWVTNAGLVATASDSALASLQVASTVDAGGATRIWSIDDIAETLQTALAANECFVVATRTTDGDGNSLFTLSGEVAFADWVFRPTVGDAHFLILKFASLDIRTLANGLSNWTDGASFNSDPTIAQANLIQAIDAIEAAASGDPLTSALYATLWNALTDPAWNGVMSFAVPATSLPATVSGMLPGRGLSAVALAVQTNDLGAANGTATVTASAPFAVVDMETADTSASPANGKEFGYSLDRLLAGFDNGTLSSFNATGRLEINSLFSLPAARQTAAGEDAPDNIVPLSGSYQQPATAGAAGYYAFVSTGTAAFRAAYDYAQTQTAAQILKTVTVSGVQFVPVDGDTSRFSISGTLTFNPPAQTNAGGTAGDPYLYLGAQPTVDLFDLDALPYSDLGIVMTAGDGGKTAYALDVSKVGFPTPGQGLRTGLATDLPLNAAALLPAGSVSSLGAIPLQVPTGWTIPVDAFDYAIAYTLTLGTTGLQAARSGSLTGTLYLGWTAAGSYSLGLLIDGIDQNRAVTLQGVAKLSIGAVAIAGALLPDGRSVRTELYLRQCSLNFMGTAVPGNAQPFTIPMFGVPFDGTSGTAATGLPWYGAATTRSDIANAEGIGS
ncbi:hypothetical protein [Azospirillum soli]|uniref:hypothetical protein n=1 Tax=Azospirillum soli TaxID=1304799 RepID=UPI001AE9F75D|nr:hypothetical protein [Azospirillum soli]MBP2312923.1 hypothetical protein [Azospirillum soli]